jgi:anti-sigma-K factor RskA
MNEQEFAELAAGHALHALGPDDERAFVAALDAHPEWMSIVGPDEDTAAMLAETVDEVAPAPSTRDAILSRIADLPAGSDAVASASAGGSEVTPSATRDGTTAGAGTAPRARRIRRRWLALAASIVLVAAVAVGTAIGLQHSASTPATVALQQIESASDAQMASSDVSGGGSATLHWSTSLGRAVLVTDGMPALPSGRTYELWAVRGDTPIPAGTFDSGGGQASAVVRGAMKPGDTIAVTIEQSGGSPTGTPSSPPIVTIPTA